MSLKVRMFFFLGLFILFGSVFNIDTAQATAKSSTFSIQDLYLPVKNSKVRTEKISHIVIHFTSNAAMKPKDPYNIHDVYRIFQNSGVSSHYVIGRNGEVYRFVSEDRVAYHAGKGNLPSFPALQNKLNEVSIGIELLAVGTKDEMLSMMPAKTYDQIASWNKGYTNAQYITLNQLLDEILTRYPTIKRDRLHIVGHDEYAPGRKTDPGKLFDWSRINLTKTNYTVQPGDTLWGISKRFGSSVDSIVRLNHLKSYSTIWVGQKLRIPTVAQGINYTVQSGDSLWKISQKFNVSIETITAVNHLNRNNPLYIGQKLKIPQ